MTSLKPVPGVPVGLPMFDERPGRPLGLFGDLVSSLRLCLFVVVRGAGDPVVTATGSGIGTDLELALFVQESCQSILASPR
jgi:hypothetical protein